MPAKVTSARPIISAAAVAEVLRGLRMAFCLARLPGSRKALANGQPIHLASGRAISGLRMATPRKITTAPAPTTEIRLSTSRNSPSSSRPTPISVTSEPMIERRRIERDGGVAASARIAATGGTRVARSAGMNEDTSVITTPTTIETITVRSSKTVPVDGRSMPTAPSTPRRPSAITTPNPRPIAEATSPTRPDSSSTEPSTWRRLAPRQRSRASSRVRCATMIEKVLKIRKAPTNSATPANASSAVEKKPRPSWISLAERCAWSAPVMLSYLPGTAPATRSRSCSGVTPGLGDHVDLVELALAAQDLLGGLQVEDGQGRAGQVVRLAEAHDPGHRVGPRRALRQDLDLVADLEALLGSGSPVDGDLVRAGRYPARPHREVAVQLGRLRGGHAQRGRAAGGDGLTVLADELREAVDRALGDLDAVDALDLLEQRGGHGITDIALVTGEGLPGLDDHVDALGGVLEELAEDNVHGVGEHIGARHEAHSEHDRQRGERKAELVGQQSLDGRVPHGPFSPRASSSGRGPCRRWGWASRRRPCRPGGTARGRRGRRRPGRGSPSRSSGRTRRPSAAGSRAARRWRWSRGCRWARRRTRSRARTPGPWRRRPAAAGRRRARSAGGSGGHAGRRRRSPGRPRSGRPWCRPGPSAARCSPRRSASAAG